MPSAATTEAPSVRGPVEARTGLPPVHAAPTNSGRPRNQSQQNAASRTQAAREALAKAGQDMAAGKFTSREQAIEPAAPAQPTPGKPASETLRTPASPAPVVKAEPAETATPEVKAADDAATAERAKSLTLARRALARDGWTPEALSKLEEDTLVEVGERAAKRQSDNDRDFNKLRQAAAPQRGPDGKFAPAAPQAGEESPAKAPAAESTGAEANDIDALIDAAAPDIGDAGVKLLKNLFSTAVKGIEAKYAAKHGEQDSITTEMLYSQGYDRVSADYAEALAADPKAFDEVAENFRSLVASGRYGRGQIGKAWSDAALMQFGPKDEVRNSQRKALARQAAADVGRVDPGSGNAGGSTNAPITDKKTALTKAAEMMAANPGMNLDKLKESINRRIQGG